MVLAIEELYYTKVTIAHWKTPIERWLLINGCCCEENTSRLTGTLRRIRFRIEVSRNFTAWWTFNPEPNIGLYTTACMEWSVWTEYRLNTCCILMCSLIFYAVKLGTFASGFVVVRTVQPHREVNLDLRMWRARLQLVVEDEATCKMVVFDPREIWKWCILPPLGGYIDTHDITPHLCERLDVVRYCPCVRWKCN